MVTRPKVKQLFASPSSVFLLAVAFAAQGMAGSKWFYSGKVTARKESHKPFPFENE
ncbi:hypothetical protein M2447_001012 [Ereboglobus sp. PH5-10]|nr:hypothetical protein [Ereboglobus sp. PH5-10]